MTRKEVIKRMYECNCIKLYDKQFFYYLSKFEQIKLKIYCFLYRIKKEEYIK